MTERPKRKVHRSTEIPTKISRKWKAKEIETLLNCIMKYGHKDFERIEKHLPGRGIENVKTFLRTAHDRAAKKNSGGILDPWIDRCNSPLASPWRDCLQIAQVLKYLSVDGLIENHPLPGSCQGIDFGKAYKVIYQALMGYPIQPVNKPTAEFILASLTELKSEIKKQTDAIKNVQSFFQKKHGIQHYGLNSMSKSLNEKEEEEEGLTIKKPLRVYERKKPHLLNSQVTPSLKIIVEEKNLNSEVGSSKDFSLTVEGNDAIQPTIIKVPVPCRVLVNKDEEDLLKSLSYNPFQIPGKWLEEPLHLNLILKL